VASVICACSYGERTGAPIRNGNERVTAVTAVTAAPAVQMVDEPGRARFRMRGHLGDLREVQRLLILGKLEEARSRAFLLTRAPVERQSTRWPQDVDDMTQAAQRIVQASSVQEALGGDVDVARACANCHQRSHYVPAFPPLQAAPADRPTVAARMARYQWAVDRLWEGMIGGGDHRWELGLSVLADGPLVFSSSRRAPVLAAQLRRAATRERSRLGGTVDDRARAYREILAICAACHLSQP
jgi:cytochrome c553